jgi:negative regulator of flagellin synthesis FlgM
MAIEINGSSTPQTGRTADSDPLRIIRSEADGTGTEPGKDAGTDSVRLTGIAALMQRLDSRITTLPVVDTARVNTIRQSIADGSYHPDPQRVADRLIDHEIALLGRAHGHFAE